MGNYFAGKSLYFSEIPQHLFLNFIELLLKRNGGNFMSSCQWTKLHTLVLCNKYGIKRLEEAHAKNESGKYNIEIISEEEFISKLFGIDEQELSNAFASPITKYSKGK